MGSAFRVHFRLVIATLGVITLVSSPAAAQTASIIGQVTDSSGAVLPGVTVTATSPALQVPEVTEVTNALGEYRLAPLPIGEYRVTYDLSGFQAAQRQGIRLTVGFTARVDVALDVATVAESVTVSGTAAVIDVQATASSTLLTKEQLELTPTSRSGLITFLSLAPGVRANIEVGGNNINANPVARAFGQGGEPWYTLEGVATATLGGAGNGNFYDYQTVEEARVQTLGTDAESPTRGVQVQAVVKSGGNDFHGGFSWGQTSDSFQGDNIDDELRAIGITSGNALNTRYDFGGDLGGRIITNKLWFYGAARKQGNEYQVLNVKQPDGSPAIDDLSQRFLTGKVSYQYSASNRFVGFYQELRKVENEDVTELVAWETRSNPHNQSKFAKVEWQGVRGNAFIATLQAGYRQYLMNKELVTEDVGKSDIGTQLNWGAATNAGQLYHEHRLHYAGSATLYKPDWVGGNHEFKAGFDFIPDESTRYTVRRKFNYSLIFNNGAPFQMAAFNSPTTPPVRLNYLGLYVRDVWTIARRLTLNVGARFADNNAWVPEQCRDAADSPGNVAFPASCYPEVRLQVWKSVAPRLRASYILTGDGKTVIKGGWGRYDHIRQINDLLRVNRNSIGAVLYRWNDLNGNGDYDTGEVNLDPNGPDFVRKAGPPSTSPVAGSFGADPPASVVNPDLKQPKSDEYSASIERELPWNLGVRLTGIHSRYNNIYRLQNNLRPYSSYNVPVTRPDPVTGTMFTYYEFPIELSGARFEQFMPVTDPSAGPHTFSSFELAGFKRLSNRWQIMASYSATKKNRPVILGLTGGDGNVQAADLNPNGEINTSDRTWDWTGKASGAYVFAYDILVSANFEHRSGDPFARQVQFTGGRTIPSIVVNVEPIGTRRLPNINLLSLKVEKSFRFQTSQRLAVRVDIFNALNANTATAVQFRSGATFLRPQAILPPRVAEFSLSYGF